MLDDHQLLRRYADGGSEAAFGELVARYVNAVYSTALRRVGGDAHLAQDVAQLVFTDLARKARSLPKSIVLGGWLHRATRYAATQLIRTNSRRQAREQEAVVMSALKSESTPDWEQIRPLLDDALDELGGLDRDALVLRFFEQRSLVEVGQALGSNEEAARKRVGRALEKLRIHLARRGITTTALALSAAIPANALQVAPVGLTATLTSGSLAGAVAGTGAAIPLLNLMTMTKLKMGLAAIIVAGTMTPIILQQQTNTRLRSEIGGLRRQTEEMVQLRDENQRLAALRVDPEELQRLRREHAELMRLRGEVALLRKEREHLLEKSGAAVKPADAGASGREIPVQQDPAFQKWRDDTQRNLRSVSKALKEFAEDCMRERGEVPNWVENGQVNPLLSRRYPEVDWGSIEVVRDKLPVLDQIAVSEEETQRITANLLVARTRQPWPAPDGRWGRAYAYLSGGVTVRLKDDPTDSADK